MDFITLNALTQLNELKEKSFNKLQVIFKHSTRCPISKMALSRIDRATEIATADYYLLKVIEDRPVSNAVAETFNVQHQSPQILLIKNGSCIFTESQNAISMEDIFEQQ